jgi:hypothetical protein
MQEKPHKNVDNDASLEDRGSHPMSATEWRSTGKYSCTCIYSRHSSGKTMFFRYIYSINREAQHSDF